MVRNTRDHLAFSDLDSPAKQMYFLLGILLESCEPEVPEEFGIQHWNEVVNPLRESFSVYAKSYFPNGGSYRSEPHQPETILETAMVAFLDYISKTTLSFVEQIAKRIRLYLAPFDEYLSEELGISASHSLAIAQWIDRTLQNILTEVSNISPEIEIDFVKWAGGGSPIVGPDRSTSGGNESRIVELLDRMGKVYRSELIEHHGNEGAAFWDLFTVGRAEGKHIEFPTERSIVEEKPLVRLTHDVAMCFSIETLYHAIVLRAEKCLSEGKLKRKFLSHRDSVLEGQSAVELARIVGKDAQVFRNVYETRDKRYEHDLVIAAKDIYLFVESKATPPKEPFRDPSKAFTRLRRQFHSDKGIQKAFEQTARLYRPLLDGKTVTLYDEDGEEVLRLPPQIADSTFCVCVTRDSYGPLATNLSLLLDKKPNDPFPWAVNIWDLENFADVWKYFRWNGKQLKSYLNQRLQLHAKAFSDDELDYVGAFIRHCGLQRFVKADCDHLQLDPTYSDIFDRIHFHMCNGQPLAKTKLVHPHILDLSESIRAGKSVLFLDDREGPIECGRNETCPCESGVKFKMCHGRI